MTSARLALLISAHRNESVRGRQMQSAGAVRDRSLRHRQMRMRPRMRAGNEAGMCPWRHNLSLALRAQETSLLH